LDVSIEKINPDFHKRQSSEVSIFYRKNNIKSITKNLISKEKKNSRLKQYQSDDSYTRRHKSNNMRQLQNVLSDSISSI
jgi:uncharacterized protein YegL